MLSNVPLMLSRARSYADHRPRTFSSSLRNASRMRQLYP